MCASGWSSEVSVLVAQKEETEAQGRSLNSWEWVRQSRGRAEWEEKATWGWTWRLINMEGARRGQGA